MGPAVLLLVLLAGGGYYLTTHVPHPAAQVAHVGAAPAEAASAHPSGTPTGIQLPGRVIGTPHVRSDPSSNAIVVQDLQSGQTVAVSACSSACAWYRVTAPGQTAPGWVSSAFVNVQGDDNKLPIMR